MGPGRHALLHVYERGRPKPFRQKPQQAGRQTNYYSFRHPDGRLDNSVEELLGIVESDAVPVIRKVESSDVQLSWEERNKLALLLAFQEFRVPWMRQQMEKLYGELIEFVITSRMKVPGLLEKDLQTLKSEGNKAVLDVTPASLRKFIESRSYTLKVSPTASLIPMLQMAPVAAGYYREMNWTVLKSRCSSAFVTSDNPVVKFAPERSRTVLGLGIMNPAIQIWFPLSKTASLIIRHDQDRMERYNDLISRGQTDAATALRDAVPEIAYRSAGEATVQQMNYMTIMYATRFVFSSTISKDLPGLLNSEPTGIQFTMG